VTGFLPKSSHERKNIQRKLRSAIFHKVISDTDLQRADFVLMPCRPALFDLGAIASTVEIVTGADTRAAVVLNAAPRGLSGVPLAVCA